MKCFFFFVFLFSLSSFTQEQPVMISGYRLLQMEFRDELVDILIASKESEELKEKPLLLFCQGSLPKPLIISDPLGVYPPFPFPTAILTEKFHLAIIGKPGVPLSMESTNLKPDFTYSDSTGNFPEKYVVSNYLDYYVERNCAVLKFLMKQDWVLPNQLVVAGHSEGATIAAKLAMENPKVTHVIFASGNPMGRIMSMIQKSRVVESDSIQYAENDFDYWTYLNDATSNKDSVDYYGRTDYSFSIPPIDYLKKLKIPVLVSYGSRDLSAPFNDYLRVWTIQNKKTNFDFNGYVGLEHNFFGFDKEGRVDYAQFNWDKVASDWLVWIQKNN